MKKPSTLFNLKQYNLHAFIFKSLQIPLWKVTSKENFPTGYWARKNFILLITKKLIKKMNKKVKLIIMKKKLKNKRPINIICKLVINE